MDDCDTVSCRGWLAGLNTIGRVITGLRGKRLGRSTRAIEDREAKSAAGIAIIHRKEIALAKPRVSVGPPNRTTPIPKSSLQPFCYAVGKLLSGGTEVRDGSDSRLAMDRWFNVAFFDHKDAVVVV